MSRLIIVSNRLPFSIDHDGDEIKLRQSSGGLVSAIKSYFESDHSLEEIKEKLWVGVADFLQEDWDRLSMDRSGIDFEIKPLFVDKQVYEGYYNGFSIRYFGRCFITFQHWSSLQPALTRIMYRSIKSFVKNYYPFSNQAI